MGILKKTLLVTAIVLVVFAVAVVAFVSPVAKNLVEKHDSAYTGREITVDWAYVNPFTGYFRFEGLVIHESGTDSIFFSADGLSGNVALLKLFSQTYELTELTIQRPKAYLIDHGKNFNFSDMIEKFSSQDTLKKKSGPLHLNVLNISINDGEIHYREDDTPVDYFVTDLNISSEGMRWDVDSLPVSFAFSSGMGSGDVAGEMTADLENLNYRMEVKVDSFDLEIVNQYLKDLTNYGTFAAMLDADMRSTGNFLTADSITNSGSITLSDFHFGKSEGQDFASFDRLVIAIRELSPKDFIYHYDSISLSKPFLSYELYDSLDNIQTMFGKEGSNVAAVNADPDKFNLVIEVVKAVKQISRNFLSSQFKVGRLAVYDGTFQFNDFSLGQRFSIEFSPFSLLADSVDRSRNRVEMEVKSGIEPFGNLKVSLSVNPKDSSYFDLSYSLQNLALTMFNPYLTTHTSFPLDRGTLEFAGTMAVRDGKIDSDNHLVLLDPRAGKRVRSKDNKWIPVPLALAFIRERGNVIDYRIPIKGDLNDPEFKIRDVLFDLLKNIFVKPATSPYMMEVKTAEREIEKSLHMSWDMQKSTLSSTQEKFIDKVVKFLRDSPTAEITVSPQNFAAVEKEFILLFEAKKKYFLARQQTEGGSLSSDDSLEVLRLSIKDSAFMEYLARQVNDPLLFTVQHKAATIVKASLIDSKFAQLNDARAEAFLAEFRKKKVEDQVTFTAGQPVIPYNGFSFYEISYEGDVPDYLWKAFEKMEELDSEQPRKKYLSRRKRNEAQ